MVVCAHGSEVIPGKPASIYVDLQYLNSLIPAGSEWIRPYLPFAQPLLIETADFCVVEPPETPVFTADDLINLIRPDPISISFVAAQKLTQFFHEQLWYRLCRCLVDSTPPAPAPTEPTDAPEVNPSDVVFGPQNTACAHNSITGYNPPGGLSFPLGNNVALPVGAAYFDLTIQVNQSASGTHGVFFGGYVNFLRSDGQLANVQASDAYFAPVGPPSPAARTFRYTVPPAAVAFGVVHNQTTTVGVDRLTISYDIFCGGPPGDLGVCYADPYIRSTLSQLLGLVTLIQRQAAPFSHIRSTEHAVTDNGTIAVSGLIGVAVEVTTAPGYSGTAAGEPPRLYDIGWIALGTDDHWLPSQPISHTEMLVLPGLGGVITRIGYYLNPDAAVTIVELLREP